MPGGTDLIGAFRAYAQKALGSDFNAEKAAAAVNAWVKESGDALKIRIERETERAVKKLGLVKQSDLALLHREIEKLRSELGLKSTAGKKNATVKKVAVRKSSGASSAKKNSSRAAKGVRNKGKKKAAAKKAAR